VARARGEIDARASAIAAADYLYVRCLVAECSTSRKLGAEEEIEHCALIRVQLPGHTESHADILWEQDTATYSSNGSAGGAADESGAHQVAVELLRVHVTGAHTTVRPYLWAPPCQPLLTGMRRGSAYLPLLALLFRDEEPGCALWARTLQDRRSPRPA
jgi:hypothetical protein